MRHIFFYPIILLLIVTSCSSRQYTISSIQGEYISVIAANKPDPEMAGLVNHYKKQLDDRMGKTIGYSTEYMPYTSYQSLLTNFTADVMVKLDVKYTGGQHVDLALMNVHGHRAAIPEGNITVGDIFSTYSFENELVVLRLKGEYLNDIFKMYAGTGGAGISNTLQIVSENKKLVSAKVNGKPVEKDKIYTIVTLDYLAEGNDGMQALRKAESATHTGLTLRDYILHYIQDKTAKGEKITSMLDERVVVKE